MENEKNECADCGGTLWDLSEKANKICQDCAEQHADVFVNNLSQEPKFFHTAFGIKVGGVKYQKFITSTKVGTHTYIDHGQVAQMFEEFANHLLDQKQEEKPYRTPGPHFAHKTSSWGAQHKALHGDKTGWVVVNRNSEVMAYVVQRQGMDEDEAGKTALKLARVGELDLMEKRMEILHEALKDAISNRPFGGSYTSVAIKMAPFSTSLYDYDTVDILRMPWTDEPHFLIMEEMFGRNFNLKQMHDLFPEAVEQVLQGAMGKPFEAAWVQAYMITHISIR